MECKNCELRHRQFYCEHCLRTQYVKTCLDQLPTDLSRNSLRDIRLQTQRFGKDRDEQVAKASRALKGIEGSRMTRAGLASCQKRVEELAEGLARMKRDNDASAYFSSSHISS